MASVIYPALPRPVDIRGIFDATDSGYKAGQDWQDERKGKAAFGQYLSSLYGGQSAPQAAPQTLSSLAPAQQPKQPDYASQRVASAFGDIPGPLNGYYSALRSAESSGNDAAANPNSSATGRYQFTKGTWDGLMTTHPELGLTPDGITDPNQQERAVRALTAQNAKSLSGAGIPVNPGNLYAAHFLGAGGAGNVLKQADNTPMSALVSPEVIQANPQLANMTVGDFKQWTAGKVGGDPAASTVGPQVTGASGGLPAVPSANPASLLPPRDVMAALFQSKTTRPIAISLAQAVQGLRMDQNDPMARVKYATALANLQKIQRGGDVNYSLTPIYGKDANGNTVLGTVGSNGTFRQIDTGGFTPSTGTGTVDLGTSIGTIDKRTGQIISTTPKQVYEESFQKGEGAARGKAQGEAAASLPGDINSADQTVMQIDQLLKNPGLDSIVGPVDQYRSGVALGPAGRDALARYNQLKGKAFLQAYGMLKGGGQITEVEGAKAQDAMARMDRAQDETSFRQALMDFRDAVQQGLAKLRERAGQGGQPTQPQNDGWQDVGGGVRIRQVQ